MKSPVVHNVVLFLFPHGEVSPSDGLQTFSLSFFCLLSFFFEFFVSPLGHLKELAAFAAAFPSLLVRLVRFRRSLGDPKLGHHQARSHAAPSHQVERKETSPPELRRVPRIRGLKASASVFGFRQQSDARVLEKASERLHAFGSESFELLQALLFQDLLDRVAAFSNTRWTPGTHCPTGRGDKRAAQCCCHLHHVVEDAVF